MSPAKVMVRSRARLAVLAVPLLGGLLVGCGSSSDAADTTTTTKAAETTETTVAGSTTSDAGSTPSSGSAPSTTVPGLADASEAQRSAPGDGTGTALLETVRVGRNDGFERIVFEFEGTPMPGYRIQWVDGPITADGSGETVDVEGDAFLEIVMEPASGVDLSSPEFRVVYEGPDRVVTTGQTEMLTDLVRTGDFEAVLTWVAGAGERAPFRVLTLTEPTRLVVDIAT